MMNKTSEQQIRERAITISIAVSVFLLIGKCVAYALSNSTAILADALESIVHVIVTLFTGLTIRYAAKPADSSHLYGHGKVVIFSIAIEGTLVLVTSLFIYYESIRALFVGVEFYNLESGLILTGIFAFINLLLGLYLLKTGKAYNAPALTANGTHVLSDMWTSISACIGVGIVLYTDIKWIDAAVAICTALIISYSGYKILREVVQEMMDEASQSDTEEIGVLLEELHREGFAAGYHQLRHRRVNGELFIELHLLYPGELTLEQTHDKATHIEKRLQEAFGSDSTRVITHLEPLNHSAAHPKQFEEEDPLKEVVSTFSPAVRADDQEE